MLQYKQNTHGAKMKVKQIQENKIATFCFQLRLASAVCSLLMQLLLLLFWCDSILFTINFSPFFSRTHCIEASNNILCNIQWLSTVLCDQYFTSHALRFSLSLSHKNKKVYGDQTKNSILLLLPSSKHWKACTLDVASNDSMKAESWSCREPMLVIRMLRAHVKYINRTSDT